MSGTLFPIYRSFNSVDPFDMISSISTAFDDYFTVAQPKNQRYSSVPKANVLKTAKGYTIEIAVPGFDRSDFEISVDSNCLTVAVSSTDNEKYVESLKRREFSYSSFSRSWALPKLANIENISSSYNAGILCIEIPTSRKDPQRKTITVE